MPGTTGTRPLTINGYWYDGRSTSRQSAVMTVAGDRYQIKTDFGVQIQGHMKALEIADRKGDFARKISWPTGESFETTANDEIDAAIAASTRSSDGGFWAHRAERSIYFVLLAVLITVGGLFTFLRWWLPGEAEQIADRLPVAVNESASLETLQTLDSWLLEPTQLDEETTESIDASFQAIIGQLDTGDFDFNLHFRRMGGMPNAFALPSGDIVLTDALVGLADKPEEIDSVILHEIGHVFERHGMQQAIRAASMSKSLSLAIGDVSDIDELAAGIPMLLLQNGYTRQSETEADNFAFDHMVARDIDPIHYATMIRKLGQLSEEPEKVTDIMSEPVDETSEEAKRREAVLKRLEQIGNTAANYLSTHPGIESRALTAEARSDEYHQQKQLELESESSN